MLVFFELESRIEVMYLALMGKSFKFLRKIDKPFSVPFCPLGYKTNFQLDVFPLGSLARKTVEVIFSSTFSGLFLKSSIVQVKVVFVVSSLVVLHHWSLLVS